MRLSNFYSLLIVSISLVVVACNGGDNSELLIDDSLFQTDSGINPADDLYSHVNNRWLNNVKIPFGYTKWGVYEELEWRSFVIQRQLLLEVLESETENVGIEKVKAAQFFKVGMDSIQSEKIGYTPLDIFFDRIDSISNNSDLFQYLAFQSMYTQCGFIDLTIEPIKTENEELNVKISPYILNRNDSLYLKSDSSIVAKKYLNFIETLSGLADIGFSRAEALDIYNFEKKLSKSYSEASNHLSNKLSEESFRRLFPNSDWESFFSKVHLNGNSIFLQSPGYFRFLDENVFGLNSSLKQVKNFLKWSLIYSSAEYVNLESYKLFADYNNERVDPRWMRVLETTNQVLGPAVGKLYTENLLMKEFRRDSKEIVENVLFGYAEFIRANSNITDSLKTTLLQEVKDLKLNVGFPDNWIDYKDLIIEYNLPTASYLGNIFLVNHFNIKTGLSSIGSSNSAVRLAPQKAKIDYDANLKELTIPAALFLEPFSDLSSLDEINYGSIGVLIARSLLENLNIELGFTANEYILKQLADSLNNDDQSVQLNLEELLLEASAFDVAYLSLNRSNKLNNIQGNNNMAKNFIYSWAKVNRKKSDMSISSKKALVNTVISTKDVFYESFEAQPNNKLFITDSVRSVLKRN